jgi:hypothetical protein
MEAITRIRIKNVIENTSIKIGFIFFPSLNLSIYV